MIDAVQLDFHVTPTRVKKFLEVYRPIVPRAIEYGATGYSFYRVEEDSHHFVHISYWDDREKFDGYWYSLEMRAVREQLVGLHDHLLMPHWGTVIERA
jgi:quinol monooxygenase YgiN